VVYARARRDYGYVDYARMEAHRRMRGPSTGGAPADAWSMHGGSYGKCAVRAFRKTTLLSDLWAFRPPAVVWASGWLGTPSGRGPADGDLGAGGGGASVKRSGWA